MAFEYDILFFVVDHIVDNSDFVFALVAVAGISEACKLLNF